MASARKVSTLTVDLQANVNGHNRNVNKARAEVRRYATSAKAANDASYSLAGGFSAAANQAGVMYGPLNGISGRLSYIASGLTALGPAGFAAAAGVSLLTVAANEGLDVFSRWEQQGLRIEAVLKATGNASGLTKAQIKELTHEIALGTLASVDGANDAAAALLTFKTVQGDVFRDALRLSQDMVSIMGGNMRSNAIQLGKALSDPVRGLTALNKAGVDFTPRQKEMIKHFVESNRLLDAQSVVINRVKGQLVGSGSGEAQGLAGAYDTLGQRQEEFLADMVEITGVAAATTSFINTLAQGIRNLHVAMMPNDQERFDALFRRRMELMQDHREMVQAGGRDALPVWNPFGHSKSGWTNTQRELQQIEKEMREIQERRKKELVKQGQAQADAERAAASARKAVEESRAAARREKQEKERKEQAKRAQQRLSQDQQAGAQRLAALDSHLASESGRLALQHAARIEQIKSVKLTEQEIARRGYESLEQLQKDYIARENLDYAVRQEELEIRHQEQVEREKARREKELEDLYQAELKKRKASESFDVSIGAHFQELMDNRKTEAQQTAEHIISVYQTATDGLSGLFADVLVQGASARKGLANLLRQMGMSMIKHWAKMRIQKAIQDRLGHSGYVSQVVSQAAAQSNLAALNALASTAAIPVVGPLMAPAAAAAMMATAAPFAAAAISASTMGLAGMAHNGFDNIPREGTWLLDGGERVVSARQNKDLTDYLSRKGHSGVTINIVPNPERAGQVDDHGGDQITVYVDATLSELEERVARGGNRTSRVMEATYGLRRNVS